MAAADYDRAYRPDAAPAPAPATAGEFDRPYRNEVVPYGDRRLDIVVKPPARSPPPPLPASTRSGGGAGSAWFFSDPEMKRRRRVASYKAYSVEGKVKASLRRGFRWIKAKCSELIHGWLVPAAASVRPQIRNGAVIGSWDLVVLEQLCPAEITLVVDIAGDGGDEEEELLERAVAESCRASTAAEGDAGVDVKADEFIARFYAQMKLQRQISWLQYNEMMQRSVS
ncbi:hypothetical protein C2845_PM01G12840 [Panicum miliaceum]|uniref:Uncharacterized protein n=1 Tax=Panicum miliaceum TaxID=4540 RepID=A0A3L6TRE0_PANMI|nr:hypothetical protein C2845_PM01G12840 [Panicum miliaceum]